MIGVGVDCLMGALEITLLFAGLFCVINNLLVGYISNQVKHVVWVIAAPCWTLTAIFLAWFAAFQVHSRHEYMQANQNM